MKNSSLPLLPDISGECIALERINYYRQERDTHPVPYRIAEYTEKIELITWGRGWILDGGRRREVLPGDLIWNKPGDFTVDKSDFKNPYQCLTIILGTKKKMGLGMPRFTRWPHQQEVQQFAREIYGAFVMKTRPLEVIKNYALSRLLFHIASRQSPTEWDSLPIPLQGALKHMEFHCASPLSVGELARTVGWSVPHLHKMFQRHLNTSPRQWLIKRRLEVSRELLLSSLEPIKQIALECGFADTASFSHAFKAHTKLSPSVFRKRNRSSDER